MNLEVIKNRRVHVGILLIMIGAIIYFSLLFEIKPESKCYGFYGLIENPAGADVAAAGFRGSIVWDKNQSAFPFGLGVNQRTNFV